MAANAKSKSIAYWVTTVIIALMLLSGGIAELARVPGTIAGMTLLGYPPYFSSILGTWKVLGTAAILLPGFPRLKEWAYAGIFFDLTGASISHIMCDGNVGHIITPLILVLIAAASWALRPRSRRLGVLVSANVAGPTSSENALAVNP
jgi:uncharacterized membrane protein YphA (DoxX/SURF4 family)